jgi:hypothetical protein
MITLNWGCCFGRVDDGLYTNGYFKATFSNLNAPRVIVYPNNDVAAHVLNYHKDKGAAVIKAAGCLPDNANAYLCPMCV